MGSADARELSGAVALVAWPIISNLRTCTRHFGWRRGGLGWGVGKMVLPVKRAYFTWFWEWGMLGTANETAMMIQ